jgi:ketosteroid isomerase-like protein
MAAELHASREAFVAAINARDSRTAAAAYADDARLAPPSADLLVGREAIESFWRTGFDAGLSTVDLSPTELQDLGALVCEVGGYALEVTSPEGTQQTNRGRYLVIWRRRADGRWQRAVEMLSPDPTAQSIGSRSRPGHSSEEMR